MVAIRTRPISELPFAVQEWPLFRERFDSLREATEINRALWRGGFVDYVGRYFRLCGARLCDLPERPPQLDIAASGDKVAAFVGEAADGIVAKSARGTDFGRDVPSATAADAAVRTGREPGALERDQVGFIRRNAAEILLPLRRLT